MALTGWGVNDYLEASPALWPGSEPFGISIWHYVPTGTDPTGRAIISQGQDGGDQNVRYLNWGASNSNRVLIREVNTSAGVSALPYSFDAWNHVSGAYVSTTLREVWINGGGKGTDTTSQNPSAPDITLIGKLPGPIVQEAPATVGLASISIWDLTGFTEANRDAWAAECASGANPNTMNGDVGQPWEGALVNYATLFDLSAPNLGSYTQIGTLSAFGSHPPVNGEGTGLPDPPALVADATSWDAVHLTATAGADTDSIEIYRSLTSPVDPQTDTIVATLVPDGQAFDDNRVPSETYFYLAVANNVSGSTNGTEQEVVTWTDDAIETFVNNDSIEIPFTVPDGERATEIRLKAGTAIRDLSVLTATGALLVEVRDQDNNLVASHVFNNLLNDSEEELDDLIVSLSPQPVGPQTITATYTSSISL